jgi:hypothetical protein
VGQGTLLARERRHGHGKGSGSDSPWLLTSLNPEHPCGVRIDVSNRQFRTYGV